MNHFKINQAERAKKMTEDIENYFAGLAEGEGPIDIPVRGVTVRLCAEVRSDIAALGKMTNITQQELLRMVVTSGINAAVASYLGNSPDPSAHHEFDQLKTDFMLGEGMSLQLIEHLIQSEQSFVLNQEQDGNER